MMKHLKFFLFALSALVCLNACNENAPSGGGGDDSKPGHIEWKFVPATGVLTISGTGAMPNYTSDNRPKWEEHKDYILEVVIKDGVTSVGDRAFYDYKNLSEVGFPPSLKTIGKSAFYFCKQLQNVDLSGTALKKMGEGAFWACRQLQKVDLSGTALPTIPFRAFYFCDALTEVILPTGLQSIEGGAFQDCVALAKLHVPGSKKEVDLPSEKLISIGDSAFQYCEALPEIVFPGSVETVGDKAFMECKGLQKVDMSGSGIWQLGKQVFEKCVALETVTWKEGITTVPERAFSGCKNLKTVTNFTGAKIIEHAAFWNCSFLDLSLPASIEQIDLAAFCQCGFKEINLPAGLKKLGEGAFMNCYNSALKGLENCTQLTVIPKEAFSGVGKYVTGWTLEIPANITKIEYGAFNNCNGLNTVKCHATTPPELGNIAFVNNNRSGSSVKLFVPAASLEAYKTSSWRTYFYYDNIRPL